MTFFEVISNAGLVIGTTLSITYLALSIIYLAYQYTKGEDIPEINSISDLELSTVRYYINPFYFKNPAVTILTTCFFFIIPVIIALMWLVLIPVAAVWYFLYTTRKKNIEKRKFGKHYSHDDSRPL